MAFFQSKRARLISEDDEGDNISRSGSNGQVKDLSNGSSDSPPSADILEARLESMQKSFPNRVS